MDREESSMREEKDHFDVESGVKSKVQSLSKRKEREKSKSKNKIESEQPFFILGRSIVFLETILLETSSYSSRWTKEKLQDRWKSNGLPLLLYFFRLQ